jgi:hypothetical protein
MMEDRLALDLAMTGRFLVHFLVSALFLGP